MSKLILAEGDEWAVWQGESGCILGECAWIAHRDDKCVYPMKGNTRTYTGPACCHCNKPIPQHLLALKDWLNM